MKRVLIFAAIFLLILNTVVLAEIKKVTLSVGDSFTVGDQTIKLVKVNANSSVDLEVNGEKINLREAKGNLKVSKSRVALQNSMKNTLDPTFDKGVFNVEGDEYVSVSNAKEESALSLTAAGGEENKNIDYVHLKTGEAAKIGSKVVQLIRVSEGKAKVNLHGEIKDFAVTETFKDIGIEILFEKVLDNPVDERFDRITLKIPKGMGVVENVEPIAAGSQTSAPLLLPTGHVIKQKMKEEAIRLDKEATEANKTLEGTTPAEEKKDEVKEETKEEANEITGNAVADEQTITLKSVTAKTKGFFTSTWSWVKGLFFSEN